MRFSKLLNINNRREFDPTKKGDLLELKYFVENNRWRTACPFFTEFPWEDIPAMCLEKYAKHSLSKLK